ncbi:MAG: ATP-dependent DNA helicase PcrA, partial [Bifidobacterium criceti]|nr:ATP-dependent DNA helicase PcrA [Bifidobacterium criceti]
SSRSGSSYGSQAPRFGSAARERTSSSSSSGNGGAHFTYGTSASPSRSPRFGSSSASSRSGKVTTRKAASKPHVKPASSLDKDNRLDINDFHVGDKVSHDSFGLGTVLETQDKGRNSVITVDFGSDGVKRLMLRVAPIEKL